MTQGAQSSIIEHLAQVEAERRRRKIPPALEASVKAIKVYQQQRFSKTYADLLGSIRYGEAANFFLNELYGPRDFARRDAQFTRVVPALVRLFPGDVVTTVDSLVRLHAVSEYLDTEMGVHLQGLDVDAPGAYVGAWQATGRGDLRDMQITLTLDVGRALDGYTRKRLLRQTLRMMRGAANVAGLGDLQRFLEAGFDAFKKMDGADYFLNCIAHRERQFVDDLFATAQRSKRTGE